MVKTECRCCRCGRPLNEGFVRISAPRKTLKDLKEMGQRAARNFIAEWIMDNALYGKTLERGIRHFLEDVRCSSKEERESAVMENSQRIAWNIVYEELMDVMYSIYQEEGVDMRAFDDGEEGEEDMEIIENVRDFLDLGMDDGLIRQIVKDVEKEVERMALDMD